MSIHCGFHRSSLTQRAELSGSIVRTPMFSFSGYCRFRRLIVQGIECTMSIHWGFQRSSLTHRAGFSSSIVYTPVFSFFWVLPLSLTYRSKHGVHTSIERATSHHALKHPSIICIPYVAGGGWELCNRHTGSQPHTLITMMILYYLTGGQFLLLMSCKNGRKRGIPVGKRHLPGTYSETLGPPQGLPPPNLALWTSNL